MGGIWIGMGMGWGVSRVGRLRCPLSTRSGHELMVERLQPASASVVGSTHSTELVRNARTAALGLGDPPGLLSMRTTAFRRRPYSLRILTAQSGAEQIRAIGN